MFKHLLVPLDGSRLAEAVLPVAGYLARTFNTTVTLLHLIEQNAPSEVHGDRHLTHPDDATRYLENIAAQAFPDIKVDFHVHTTEVSNIPASIAKHVDEMRGDLVILCTHGHGGLRTLLFGSIAQQVIATGQTPVLLVHPPEGKAEPPPFECRQIVLPLDGIPEHEGGIPIALEMAAMCKAATCLVSAIPTLDTLPADQAPAAKLLPGTITALLDLSQDKSHQYLVKHQERFQQQGLAAQIVVQRGDPVDVIIEAAHTTQANLIILSTHGKKGANAFLAGSVTPRVANRTATPLLLVRAPEESRP